MILVLIFAGCANFDKQGDLVKIQKQRINKLERQLSYKQKQVDRLKLRRWMNKPVSAQSGKQFVRLKKLVKAKKWVMALKESNRLKRMYPKSVKVAMYRAQIFKKMGLRKQAESERRSAKDLRARNSSGSSTRR